MQDPSSNHREWNHIGLPSFSCNDIEEAVWGGGAATG